MSFHGVALESATQRTLHAHGFSRSSTQASLTLTDLLARYVTLLSSSCAKYAQHAGRRRITAWDAFCVLDDLGVSMEELSEYCLSEGRELGHYARLTARRVDELNELKIQLVGGLKQDRDDVIPLVYAPVPDATLPESDEGEDEDEDMYLDAEGMTSDSMVVDPPAEIQQLSSEWKFGAPIQRQSLTLPLPLSPISNPSSPTRKRPRTLDWKPPSHVPDFLPPFPNVLDTIAHSPITPLPHVPLLPPPPVRVEKPPSPISQPVTSTLSSDYFARVPYSQSTLSSVPEWHLPSPLAPAHPSIQVKSSRLVTPQTEPALIAAYHHILTHPPTVNGNFPNPARHKVAMALLSSAPNNPRWVPPDTLFSSTSPCTPRLTGVSPTFPIPINKTPHALPDSKPVKVEDKDKELLKLPVTLGRPVSYVERLSPLISQQASRIPELARNVLSPSVHVRTTRLLHPTVLTGNGQKLVYGPGVPAPWNATSTPPVAAVPPVNKPRDGTVNGISNNNKPTETPKTLPDATLFATWDYDKKDFRQPLVPGRRGRVASVQGSSSNVLSLGLSSRARSGTKVG